MKYCQNQSRFSKVPSWLHPGGRTCRRVIAGLSTLSLSHPCYNTHLLRTGQCCVTDTGCLVCCLSQDAPKAIFNQSILVTDECNVRDIILLACWPLLLVLLRAFQPYVHSCTHCLNFPYATWQTIQGTLYHLEITPTSLNEMCHLEMFCPSEYFTKASDLLMRSAVPFLKDLDFQVSVLYSE